MSHQSAMEVKSVLYSSNHFLLVSDEPLCGVWALLLSGREAPLLLLLFNAGPVDITFAQESPEVNAIVACGYPAQATGEALYRVLTATGPHSVPAGRLTATWPAQLNQVIVLAEIVRKTILVAAEKLVSLHYL